ncbi:MAG: hypothetical protein R2749_14965 [Acidimicrobiales bacterium]
MWATYEATPEAIAVKLSPASCDAARTVSNVFLLPVNRASGDPTTAATVCTVRSKQGDPARPRRLRRPRRTPLALPAASSSISTATVRSTRPRRFVPTPENLQLISRYFLDNGLVPLPSDVTLDGRPVEGIEGIVTENFRFKPVLGTDYATARPPATFRAT